jgi:hypothetical protein
MLLYVREKIIFVLFSTIFRILITSCVGYLQKKYSIIVSFVNAGAVKATIFLVGVKVFLAYRLYLSSEFYNFR